MIKTHNMDFKEYRHASKISVYKMYGLNETEQFWILNKSKPYMGLTVTLFLISTV